MLWNFLLIFHEILYWGNKDNFKLSYLLYTELVIPLTFLAYEVLKDVPHQSILIEVNFIPKPDWLDRF
jgi:hypothetical protein